MTTEAPKRSHHRLAKDGGCRRCGLSNRAGLDCPPGYWMTDDEARTWEAASPAQRTKLERKWSRLSPEDVSVSRKDEP